MKGFKEVDAGYYTSESSDFIIRDYSSEYLRPTDRRKGFEIDNGNISVLFPTLKAAIDYIKNSDPEFLTN